MVEKHLVRFSKVFYEKDVGWHPLKLVEEVLPKTQVFFVPVAFRSANKLLKESFAGQPLAFKHS